MFKFSVLLAAVAILAPEASAFWRLPCVKSNLVVGRLDPIVNPGATADHVHAIQGGNKFSKSVTYDDLTDSDCSSCQIIGDNSAYWTAQMYFYSNSDKTFTAVNQTGDMLVYYLQYYGSGDISDIEPFPKDFRMVAGTQTLRNYTWEDTEQSLWTVTNSDGSPGEGSQEAMAQKAVGWTCLNYEEAAEATLAFHEMANATMSCPNGMRAEIYFPSCWNGETDSDNHKSHVAYPSLMNNGDCPSSHPKRLPTLLYEVVWDWSTFYGQDGYYTFSNGDPTAYGQHGDFVNGWDIDLLDSAVQTCTSTTGLIEDCTVFDLRSENEMTECTIADEVTEDVWGPMDKLLGCNPINWGPEPSTMCDDNDSSSDDSSSSSTTKGSLADDVTSAAGAVASHVKSAISAASSAIEPAVNALNVDKSTASTTASMATTTAVTTPAAAATEGSTDEDVVMVTVTTFTTAAPVYKTVDAPEVVETVYAAKRHMHQHHKRNAHERRMAARK